MLLQEKRIYITVYCRYIKNVDNARIKAGRRRGESCIPLCCNDRERMLRVKILGIFQYNYKLATKITPKGCFVSLIITSTDILHSDNIPLVISF